MKKTLFAVLMLMATVTVSAQSTRTVKGAVIDKSGNPLPGAEVSATKGAESTTTDADGTFTLEVPIWLKSVTARYAGKRDKTMKTSDEMIFRMKNASGNRQWILNAIGGIGIGPGSSRGDYSSSLGQVGLMAANLGKWGGYAKVYWQPAGDEAGAPNFSIGATKRVYKGLHVGIGVGFVWTNQCKNQYYQSITYPYDYATSTYDYSNPSTYSYDDYYAKNIASIAPELSVFYVLGNHISLSFHYAIGIPLDDSYNSSSNYGYWGWYSTSYTRTTDDINHNIQLGIGYAF